MNDATQFFDTTAGGGGIERSLRFNSSDSAYLSRTPASSGNRKTWTFSFWYKKTKNGLTGFESILGISTSGLTYFTLRFGQGGSADCFTVEDYPNYTGYTTAVFRDSSAWYHFVVSVDTTQATASERVKVYVNGVLQSISSQPTQNFDFLLNSATRTDIGNLGANYSNYYINGYLADIHFIDGQALDPTSFGEFDDNGVWQPIEYTGTYPGNSFHLPFSDNSTAAALGTDTSGNSNTWTVNNISVAAGAGNDSLVDTPTNYGTDTGAGGEVRGNYATLNPNVGATGTTNVTLSNGNLQYANSDGSFRRYIPSTITMPPGSGKYYAEGVYTTSTQTDYDCFGIIDATLVGVGKSGGSNVAGIWAYRRNGNADIEATGGTLGISYGASWAVNDVIGIAYDSDNGSITFYKNGVSQGQLTTGITNTVCFFVAGLSNCVAVLNFGQRPFAYTAPSGYKALCTANLPDPTIADGSTAMDVALYTGNSSTQAVSGLGFSPDFVWIKSRTNPASYYFHQLRDTVRGNTKVLYSNDTSAEGTDSAFASFDSTGFTVNGALSQLAYPYVAWTWDAGTSTVTNTQGSITSQVRANPSAGFSIVTWTGNGLSNQTAGHGLGVTPALKIVKERTGTEPWVVTGSLLGVDVRMFLNSTIALGPGTQSDFYPADTSSVLGISGANVSPGHNTSGDTYVAYCFAPVAGYSAFGSYTGNGSADGPFVYTGFRSRWVMIKNASSATGWTILDTARDVGNPEVARLLANLFNSEASGFNVFDCLSNGFKIRDTNVSWNQSGDTYIYAAFAENPFKYSRAR